MKIKFNESSDFTVGIELEVQLVDAKSFALVSRCTEIIDSLDEHTEFVKHELMGSNIEIVSAKSNSVAEAGADIRRKLAAVIASAAKHDTRLSLSSTHPFSLWRDQQVTDLPRYHELLEKLQLVGRRFNIFGLHVHVGIDNAEKCIYVMNRMLYYLPYLLAVSANSPFWQGERTGLRSYRTKVFETLPTAGLPFYFKNWDDYTNVVEKYIATGVIKTIRELWWDIRPHPDFGTVEVRVCDIPASLKDVLAIASLIQSIVKKLSDEFDADVPFERPHSFVTRENKWRASRYGIEGDFLTKDGGSVMSVKEAVGGVVEAVTSVAKELGAYETLLGINDILESGTGAERQLKIFEATGSLRAVVSELATSIEREAGKE
jgi:carboxylate-amine ligase